MMSTILSCLSKVATSALVKLFSGALSCITELLKFLNGKRQDKKEAEEEAERKEKNDAIQDTCDNGTLEDLIDATKGIKKEQ